MRRIEIPENRLLGAHCSIAGGPAGALALGAEIGCTAIQIFTGPNQQWHARALEVKDAKPFCEAMPASGIRIAFAHAGYLINLAAPDSRIYRLSIDAMAVELQRADLLGLPFVVLHPGSPRDEGAKWGIARAAEAIDRVFDAAAGAKARIVLETTAGQGSSIGRTFDELSAIIDRVKEKARLGVCFDTCHAFAAGYELRTAAGYRDTWKEFGDRIGMDKLDAIHLNDCKSDLGSGVDRHTHIGKGKIGLKGFRNIMNDPRLASIPMVLETPKGDDAIKSDKRNLQTLIGLIS